MNSRNDLCHDDSTINIVVVIIIISNIIMNYNVFGGTLNLTKPNSGMFCGSRLPKQGVHWEMNSIKQWLGRLRKNWIDSIRQDLIEIGGKHSTQRSYADSTLWPDIS